ncbi:hypothetical protein [Roseateles oligotrophus]|uniref:Lipoprotein n=1 Tax=Roseateles oligotrophus TaxID=1769250 RepID=A0ABT2YBW0_9BURK|nr:hypothetical protein [Roseateles oligotrophus]MCV2366695.1 hypothetical protein [Roseateles oligotrophus]
MKSLPIKPLRRSARAGHGCAAAMLLLLTACGGGGGDAGGNAPSTPSAANAASSSAPLSSALSAQKLSAAVPETYRGPLSMPQDQIAQTAQGLPAAPGRTYLKVTVTYAGSSTPSLLWLGPWRAEGRPPRIQVPVAVQKVAYELYNSAGSVSATWSLP